MSTAPPHPAPSAPTPPNPSAPQTDPTWTFFGHWDNDVLVIEFVVPGAQDDDREDTGYWDQGLWADSGTSATQDGAMDALAGEYEADGWRWAGDHEQTPDD